MVKRDFANINQKVTINRLISYNIKQNLNFSTKIFKNYEYTL